MTSIVPNPKLQTFAQMYSTVYQPVNIPAPQNVVSPNAAQNETAPNLNADNALEKMPKSDTVTFAGKTVKKKTAIIAGLGALAAATVISATIYFWARMGKVPTETRVITDDSKQIRIAAEDMAQRANELAENVQKKIDTVVELFKNGGKDADGKVVATIKDDGYEKIMEECTENGIRRVSCFRKDVLDSIEELFEDGKKNRINFFMSGKLDKYQEGYECLSGGTRKAAKRMEFSDGKLSEYCEGYECLSNGTRKAAKRMEFLNGEPVTYGA